MRFLSFVATRRVGSVILGSSVAGTPCSNRSTPRLRRRRLRSLLQTSYKGALGLFAFMEGAEAVHTQNNRPSQSQWAFAKIIIIIASLRIERFEEGAASRKLCFALCAALRPAGAGLAIIGNRPQSNWGCGWALEQKCPEALELTPACGRSPNHWPMHPPASHVCTAGPRPNGRHRRRPQPLDRRPPSPPRAAPRLLN